MICWENYMPLLRTAMYAKGSNCIVPSPWTTGRPGFRPSDTSPSKAAVSCCRRASSSSGAISRPAIPPNGSRLSQDVLIREGVASSGLWDNLGRAEVRGGVCPGGGPRPGRLARAKFDFDVVGHYSRPDVFRLEVNERPMKSVAFNNGSE